MVMNKVNAKFALGQLVATRGVVEVCGNTEIYELLKRHANGDWGELCDDDKALNDHALEAGEGRLFSGYDTPKGRVWIITEHDRSVTTILFPHEY
jgi:hypothetical protein